MLTVHRKGYTNGSSTYPTLFLSDSTKFHSLNLQRLIYLYSTNGLAKIKIFDSHIVGRTVNWHNPYRKQCANQK